MTRTSRQWLPIDFSQLQSRSRRTPRPARPDPNQTPKDVVKALRDVVLGPEASAAMDKGSLATVVLPMGPPLLRRRPVHEPARLTRPQASIDAAAVQ